MIHLSRRVAIGAGLGFAAVLGGAGRAASGRPLARIIVDNDFAGDPDGLLALAYQLAAPTTRTVLVTTSALDAGLAGIVGLPAGRTAARGAAAAASLLDRIGPGTRPPIVGGAESFGVGPAGVSPAAHAIVAEARRADAVPLFLTCGGPLTNVAAALRLDPTIARRMTVVWIGGTTGPGTTREYNMATDPAAARQVIEASDVPLWQVPLEAYAQALLSRTELAVDFRPISPVTEWLYDRLVDLPAFVPASGAKGIGDCALVALTGITDDAGRHADRLIPAAAAGPTRSDRRVRLYESLDLRLLMADMLATFRAQAAAAR